MNKNQAISYILSMPDETDFSIRTNKHVSEEIKKLIYNEKLTFNIKVDELRISGQREVIYPREGVQNAFDIVNNELNKHYNVLLSEPSLDGNINLDNVIGFCSNYRINELGYMECDVRSYIEGISKIPVYACFTGDIQSDKTVANLFLLYCYKLKNNE